MGNSLLSMISGFHCYEWSVFCCFSSDSTLLELHYGGRVTRSRVAWEQGNKMGTSVREAECQINVRLFLDEYPWWELGTPHQSVILHEMFLHAANRGWKEAECMVCWCCQGCVAGPDPGAVQSAMELVGYWTSGKEIWDVYQSVYLLQRLPGIPSCGEQIRKRTIRDILSSLKDHVQRHEENLEPWGEWRPRPNRWELYEEALRVACKRVLDTAEALQGDIERLSLGQRNKSRSWTCCWTCSWSCSRSHSRSWSRSHSRAHSQSQSWGSSQDRQLRSPDGPLPGRRVTF